MGQERRGGWGTVAEGLDIKGEEVGHIYKQLKNVKWEPHPMNENVQLGFILTKKGDGVEVTSLLAKVPKGEDIPEHTHQVHDIIFPLSGKGKIWIKGLGEFELQRGVLVNVPPGAVHKVYDVTEDLEIYDIFSGPIL